MIKGSIDQIMEKIDLLGKELHSLRGENEYLKEENNALTRRSIQTAKKLKRYQDEVRDLLEALADMEPHFDILRKLNEESHD